MCRRKGNVNINSVICVNIDIIFKLKSEVLIFTEALSGLEDSVDKSGHWRSK